MLWLATSGPALIAFVLATILGAQPLTAIIIAVITGIAGGVVVGMAEGVSELQPQENTPQFQGGKSVGDFKQWDFRATLFAELESQDDTEYTFALIVNHSTVEGAAMIITSEVNQDASAARFGTHIIKLFGGEEPTLIATGDEWALIDHFRDRALKLAAKELELTGTWNRTSYAPASDPTD